MNDQEIRRSPGIKRGFFYGYIVVVATLCIMAAMWGTYYAFGVFFKPVSSGFGWARGMTSGAFSLSMAAQGLLGIVMGGLTDRFGPRLVMTLSGFLLGLGYLLMSQLGAIWQLYLFYGVMVGIGMSGAFIPLLSTVARWFVARRSMMTGIVLTGTGVGALIAPPVANQLISAYDWRTSYLVMGIIVLVVVVLAAQFLRRDPTKIGQVPYGESKEEKSGLKSDTGGLSLREAVCTRQCWTVFGIVFALGFCLFAIMVHMVPHATDLGISAASAASILATVGGAMIVGRLVLGSVADRIGNRRAFIIGFILMSAALFWLVLATELWMLYLFAVVFGFAHAGAEASTSPLIAGLFGLRSHGSIFGVIGLGFSIGSAIAPFLTGYAFDLTSSYQVAFLTSAAVGVVGLVLTVLLKPIRLNGIKS